MIGPGVHPNLSLQAYLDIPAVSNSMLRAIEVSPKHYRYWETRPRRVTDRMMRGTAGHIAVFQLARFLDGDSEQRVLPVPETNPDTGKAWRKSTNADKAFRAENAGCLILSRDEYFTALAIGRAVRDHPQALSLLRRGRPEVTIVWEEPCGILCKGRCDWLETWVGKHGVEYARAPELKTCSSIEPRIFVREAARRGYHKQREWYRRGLTALGYTVDESPIIAVEQDPPNDVACYRVQEPEMAAAAADNNAALDKLLECRERNEWPGKVPGGWADLDFEEHGCGWRLGDDGDNGLDMTGVERRNG